MCRAHRTSTLVVCPGRAIPIVGSQPCCGKQLDATSTWGPRHLSEIADEEIVRFEPRGVEDFAAWLHRAYGGGQVTLTYVVMCCGELRVSDRHTEHVSCARGRSVLAAGELTVLASGRRVDVVEISNQSTGYCPEPSCFEEVARALYESGLVPPKRFSHAFVFRRCPNCEGIVLIKEDAFECAECEVDLPREWNF